ncbi:MAG: DUF6629 family protein [Bacteroidota bacterium]
MCFSAEASFGASVILGTVGVFTLKKANTTSEKFFASLPLVFGVQQFVEGFLWIAIENNYVQLQNISTHLFIIIAQIIWPVLVPFSIMLMEPEKKRKSLLNMFLLFGGIASVYLAYCIAIYSVKSEIDRHHIFYALGFPHVNKGAIALFYVIPTAISPFISSIKRMKILGALILGTFIFTQYFYTKHAISVWCFFAAIMSAEVWVIMNRLNKDKNQTTSPEMN